MRDLCARTGLAGLLLTSACTDDAAASSDASGDTAGTSAPPTSSTGDGGTEPQGPTSTDSAGPTTGPTTAGTSDPPGSESGETSEGWVLVWSDEFDGSEIDPQRWEHEVNCWGGGNGEQQCYTDSTANAFVADGVLQIVAIEGPTSGPAVNDDDPAYDPNDTSATLPYSSARLRTRNRGDWRFGRVEVRAKLPRGQGTWAAIWMLPTDAVYGGWAASGEIDIMEAVNLGVDGENRVHGTLHYGSYWPANVSSGTEYVLPGGLDPSDDFHDYALEWEDGEIRWYVDGHHYATQRSDGWYTLYDDGTGTMVSGDGAAPFDETFHLLLNLAVGGAWAGNVNAGGIDSSAFPQALVIDYVRVYECSVDPSSGDGCDTIGDDFEVVEGHMPP
mgnify:CR=1 FL=1